LSVSNDDEDDDASTTASSNTVTVDASKYITFSKYQQRKIKKFNIIKKKDHSDYKVISGINKYSTYKSVNKGWLCTCRHFALFQTPCSHIKAVILYEQTNPKDERNT